MYNLKIETYGKILEGEYKDWYIFVKDDKENTGGYLILFNASLDPNDSNGFDAWVENFYDLEECFQKENWKIHWLD